MVVWLTASGSWAAPLQACHRQRPLEGPGEPRRLSVICEASRAVASDEAAAFQAFMAATSAGRLAGTVEDITAQALPGFATARHPCNGGAVALSVRRTGLLDAAYGSGGLAP